jgi:Region found in RelA / SpoT proteins
VRSGLPGRSDARPAWPTDDDKVDYELTEPSCGRAFSGRSQTLNLLQHNPVIVGCEIQVRTLFEEVWGEIDHALNYPQPTTSLPCKEQLRVLAKLASTGTRLADAIFAIRDSRQTLFTGLIVPQVKLHSKSDRPLLAVLRRLDTFQSR